MIWAALLASIAGALGVGRPLAAHGRALAASVTALIAIGLFGMQRAAGLIAPRAAPWLALLVACAGIALFATGRQRPARPAADDPFPAVWRKALAGLAIGACVVALILVAEHSVRFPDGDWDAWFLWNLRARFLFRGEPAGAFAQGLPHIDYPFLVPALVASGWSIFGETQAVPAVIGALFGAACAAMAGLGVARIRGATAGWVAAGLFAATPWMALLAWSQYADLPLASFLMATAALLAISATESAEDRRLLVAAGVTAGLMTLCKNEGLLALAGIAAALLLTRRPRALAWLAVGAAPMLILLWLHKRSIPRPNELVTGFAAISKVLEPGRWRIILGELADLALYVRGWGPMLLAVPIAAAATLVMPASRASRTVGIVVATMSAGFLAVFLLSPHELRWAVNRSIDRLVGQLWPLIVAWAVLALAPRARTA